MSADDVTKIEIGLPLPIDVASTLMSTISVVYPGAMIRTDGRDRTITMTIPNTGRRATIPKRKVKAALVTADENAEANLHNVGEVDGQLSVDLGLPEAMSLELAHIAAGMLSAEGTVNYLEAECRDGDGNRYVVCAARSQGQTPHALRLAAEKRAEMAEARLAEMESA